MHISLKRRRLSANDAQQQPILLPSLLSEGGGPLTLGSAPDLSSPEAEDPCASRSDGPGGDVSAAASRALTALRAAAASGALPSGKAPDPAPDPEFRATELLRCSSSGRGDEPPVRRVAAGVPETISIHTLNGMLQPAKFHVREYLATWRGARSKHTRLSPVVELQDGRRIKPVEAEVRSPACQSLL